MLASSRGVAAAHISGLDYVMHAMRAHTIDGTNQESSMVGWALQQLVRTLAFPSLSSKACAMLILYKDHQVLLVRHLRHQTGMVRLLPRDFQPVHCVSRLHPRPIPPGIPTQQFTPSHLPFLPPFIHDSLFCSFPRHPPRHSSQYAPINMGSPHPANLARPPPHPLAPAHRHIPRLSATHIQFNVRSMRVLHHLRNTVASAPPIHHPLLDPLGPGITQPARAG